MLMFQHLWWCRCQRQGSRYQEDVPLANGHLLTQHGIYQSRFLVRYTVVDVCSTARQLRLAFATDFIRYSYVFEQTLSVKHACLPWRLFHQTYTILYPTRAWTEIHLPEHRMKDICQTYRNLYLTRAQTLDPNFTLLVQYNTGMEYNISAKTNLDRGN